MVGTFFVAKSGKYTWRLMVRTYADGGETTQTVAKIAWVTLGFNPSWTIEQARERARQLNKQNAVERNQSQKTVRIAARVASDKLSHSAFVPAELNQAFLDYLDDNTSLKGQVKARSHWVKVKKMVIELQLKSEDFADSKKRIYKYFGKLRISPAYVKKLLRVLNLYGKFVGRISKVYYEPIPNPKGHDRETINDTYLDKPEYFGPSEPLTPELLETLKDKLKPEQYAWLYITVWLGLRPSEVEAIAEDRLASKVWRVESGTPDTLWVYQAKLTSVPRPKRWKPIPLQWDEQRTALKYIYEGHFSKPLTKTLVKYAGIQVTLYGGRKNFVDLCLDRGSALEDIATWMGHTSIQMTWTHYKNKRRTKKIAK